VLLVIGLVGGLLITIGVFLPWVSIAGVYSWSIVRSNPGIVMLFGGVLAIIGSVMAIGVKRVPIEVGYITTIGGIITLSGWLWLGREINFRYDYLTYGCWVTLIGIILALVGTLGVVYGSRSARPTTWITCQKCKAQVPETSRFCPHCGSSTGAATAKIKSTGTKKCPKCKLKVTAGAKFCPGCGAKIT
jgi:RNA polymerase subunit RPABC4/transcription elongation factor Spt4